MKKLFFFFVFLVLISLGSSNVNGVTISSCSYTNVAGSGVILFRASDITNAHIESPALTNYPYFVRCSGTDLGAGATFNPAPPGNSGNAAFAYTQTDSHVALSPITFLSGGGVAYLYDTSAANAQISCGYVGGSSGGDGNSECVSAGWDTCVYSASGIDNAHVGACSGVGISYGYKMCCRVGAPPAGGVLSYISIQPTRANREIGVPTTYTTLAHFNDGSAIDISSTATYNSNDTSRATCASNTCTGSALGSVSITASYLGKTNTSILNIVPTSPLLFSHTSIKPQIATIDVNEIQSYDLFVHYANGSSFIRTTAAGVSFYSSDVNIATMVTNNTISRNNNALGISSGDTLIVVLSNFGGGSLAFSPLKVLGAGSICSISSTSFTWIDSSGTLHNLDDTLQSDGTPVNMTLFTNGCDGRDAFFRVYQEDCTGGNDPLVAGSTYTDKLISSNKSYQEIILRFDTGRGTLGCPDVNGDGLSESQYYFEVYNIVPANNIVGDRQINSSIIYVNQTFYTPGDPPCTGCYPPGSSACSSPRSCFGVPLGYNCISETGYCLVPAGAKCCLGIESGAVGDIKIIITREGECRDVGRNDETGQVTEIWRRVNVTDNQILESRTTQKDCLLAKPANVPFFSLVNVVIVTMLISIYYVFRISRKSKI